MKIRCKIGKFKFWLLPGPLQIKSVDILPEALGANNSKKKLHQN